MPRRWLLPLSLVLLGGCTAYRAHRPQVETLYLQDGTEGYSINCGDNDLACAKRAGDLCGSAGFDEVRPAGVRMLRDPDADFVLVIRCKSED